MGQIPCPVLISDPSILDGEKEKKQRRDGAMATWVEDITQALRNLGGQAHRRQIIDEVKRIRKEPLPISLDETIQERIQAHSSDSSHFRGIDLFKKMGDGVWALRNDTVTPTPAQLTPKKIEIIPQHHLPSESFEEIENILKTIKQYREYNHPDSHTWKEYVFEIFHLLGFTTGMKEPRLYSLNTLGLDNENKAIVCYVNPQEDFIEIVDGITWDSFIQHAAAYYCIEWGILTNGIQLKLKHFPANINTEESHSFDLDGIIMNERMDGFISLFSAFSSIKDNYVIHENQIPKGMLTPNSIQSEQPKRHKLRLLFWGQLLEKAKSRTKLHSKRSPTTDCWISAGAGRSGFEFSYVIRLADAQVDLWIDKKNYDENKRLFNLLLELKDEIERKFGDRLVWKLLPDKRGSRISYVITGSGLSDTAQWDIVQEKLIDAMVRMENVLRPIILRI
jgi:hypothetical protein